MILEKYKKSEISFLNLKSVNQKYEKKMILALQKMLASGVYILGNEVTKFEGLFKEYCGTRYCSGVSNGLDALKLIFLSLMRLGRLSRGDGIIVPANTYIASIMAISETGLMPILAEPDPLTMNIDLNTLSENLLSSSKGVLAVHLYGRPIEGKDILSLRERTGMIVVEDAAQAHGCRDAVGAGPGSYSDAVGYSFFPSKNLGSLGDAGAVATNDREIDEMVRCLRNYGSSRKYVFEELGLNARLDELQAAFLSEKLKDLNALNQKRKQIAGQYCEFINSSSIQIPEWHEGHVWHQFVIRCLERDKLADYLSERGIPTLIHYPIPPHRQRAYREWGELSFPITEQMASEVLSLPICPTLNENQIKCIIKAINGF